PARRAAPPTWGDGTTRMGRPRRLEPFSSPPPGCPPVPAGAVWPSSVRGACSTGRPRRDGAGGEGGSAPPADARSRTARTTSPSRSSISSHAELPLRHVAEEHVLGSLARLEQEDVALEVRIVLVLLDAELQPRVQERAQHLVEHGEHPLARQRPPLDRVAPLLGHIAAHHPVVKWPKRIVADHQLRPVL